MTKENNKNVIPFCKDYWKKFQQDFENTALLRRVLNETTPRKYPVFINKKYYDQRFFYIPKRGEILSKVLAGKVGAIDKDGVNGVYVELLLELSRSHDDNKEIFFQLDKHKDTIESQLCSSLEWKKLGLSLEWEEGEKTERSKIFVHNKNFNPRDENNWKKQHEWIIKTITEFERVFTPLL